MLNAIIVTDGGKDPVPQKDDTETLWNCMDRKTGKNGVVFECRAWAQQRSGGGGLAVCMLSCEGAGTGTLDLYVSLNAMKSELWLSPPREGGRWWGESHAGGRVFIGGHEG